MLYTIYQQIYEKPSPLPQKFGQHGTILHRSDAMNGSAGLSPSSNQRQENNTSSEYAQKFSKENADHAAGQDALTGEITTSPVHVSDNTVLKQDTI